MKAQITKNVRSSDHWIMASHVSKEHDLLILIGERRLWISIETDTCKYTMIWIRCGKEGLVRREIREKNAREN